MNLRMLRESSIASVGDGITQEECDAMVKRIDELIAGGADPDRPLPGVIIDLDASPFLPTRRHYGPVRNSYYPRLFTW